MNNLRQYGNPPFATVVVHGGPGAPGEMAEVARELASEGMAKLATLLAKTDAYAPFSQAIDDIEGQPEVFSGVWPEANEMRRNGELLERGRRILCPVVAIHGDHDPHPARGVREPLSEILEDFRFILLEKCGHRPWLERQARETFYNRLRSELIKS